MKKYNYFAFYFWMLALCGIIIAHYVWDEQPTNFTVLIVLASPLLDMWGDHVRKEKKLSP